MQFSLLDLGMNDVMVWTSPTCLISVATLPCEIRNTKNAREHNFSF